MCKKSPEAPVLIVAFPFLSWGTALTSSLIAQLVKNPPAMHETPVRFLAWEDPLEKG